MDLPVNQIICDDCLMVMKDWPNDCVNCIITSPPYWGLRAYNTEPQAWPDGWLGELGLEPTIELYLEHLMLIFDEAERVLRKDGICFVNLGDTYNAGRSGGWAGGKHGISKPENAPNQSGVNARNIPTKSLCNIPEKFCIAMEKQGWIKRCNIIWAKGLSFCDTYSGSCMPDSARDRPNKNGFEWVYMFTKNNDTSYWVHEKKRRTLSKKPKPDYIWVHKNTNQEYDYPPPITNKKLFKKLWNRSNLWESRDYWYEQQYEEHSRDWSNENTGSTGYTDWMEQAQGRKRQGKPAVMNPLGRTIRNVWAINPQAFSEAHFATFPEKLVEPMIKMGCPEYVCTKCGRARVKIYKFNLIKTRGCVGSQGGEGRASNDDCGSQYQFSGGVYGRYEKHFIGYTDCGCGKEFRPGIVLDMFRRVRHGRRSSCTIKKELYTYRIAA